MRVRKQSGCIVMKHLCILKKLTLVVFRNHSDKFNINIEITKNSQVEGFSVGCSLKIHFPLLIFDQAYGYAPQFSRLHLSLSHSLCIDKLSLCSCSFSARIRSPDRWMCHNYHFPATNVRMTCLVGGITVCRILSHSLTHTSFTLAPYSSTHAQSACMCFTGRSQFPVFSWIV